MNEKITNHKRKKKARSNQNIMMIHLKDIQVFLVSSLFGYLLDLHSILMVTDVANMPPRVVQ